MISGPAPPLPVAFDPPDETLYEVLPPLFAALLCEEPTFGALFWFGAAACPAGEEAWFGCCCP